MRILQLNGHGISFKVDGAKLYIKDGRTSAKKEPQEYIFNPKRINIDAIVIYGHNGNLTIEAIKWLIKHNVQISILNWDGKLLTTMLPRESVQVSTKFAQYQAYLDNKKRLSIAKGFIKAKFERTQAVLNWLKRKYPNINTDFSKESKKLYNTKTIHDILVVESRVARHYWLELFNIFPDKYEFESRAYIKRPKGAGDMINCLLNYGYSILESECLRAINSTGLDAHIGFVHEKYKGKNSLAYDFQELFRFLIDLAVITSLEKDLFNKKDFIRTENYTLRLRPSGAKKLLQEIQYQFNQKVAYPTEYSWFYIILLKTRELAFYLTGKNKKLDFTTPHHTLKRGADSEELRQKILNISYTEWRKLGFSKGSLHYMKQNAKSNKPFTLYKEVKERLKTIC